MDKQQSDHIEQRIRQAAENFTPPYKEEGWQKMEALLDKEFDKKRRPAFAWWWYGLFVCLIAGGAFFYYSTGSKNQGHHISQNHSSINETERETSEGISSGEPPKATTSKTAISKAAAPQATGGNATVPETMTPPTGLTKTQKHNQNGASVFSSNDHLYDEVVPAGNHVKRLRVNIGSSALQNKRKGNTVKTKGDSKADGNTTSSNPSSIPGQPTDGAQKTNDADKIDKPQSPPTNNTLRDNTPGKALRSDTQQPTPTQEDSAVSTVNKASSENASPKKTAASKTVKLKSDDNSRPGLYLVASIASDGSTVEKFSLSNRKPVYGIGLGYRFNNRVSLQTGFYAGRKIYTAGPTDYKVNPDSYIGRMKILKIDADCIIYELPLSVRYDVIAHKNFRAYAMGGLSSFIMKRENYKYHLTGSMGYVMKDSTYSSNKNFFSSAALSVGVEQRLFNSFYIQAEPYIRVPLSGVGEGKVKLYSAGLQLGIKFQPDKKNKKH